MSSKTEKYLQKHNLPQTVENDVRVARPNLGLKADHKNSRSAAIQLFCISCMGGSRKDAAECKSYDCPLWALEFKATRGERPAGIVPTEKQYEELIESTISQAKRDAGKKLNEP
jgi:hypothetical protein